MNNTDTTHTQTTALHTILPTVLALFSFAANSLFCRLALGGNHIDPASFTVLRLGSGATALGLILGLSRRKSVIGKSGSWISAAMLLVYALAFSFAYVELTTGTGALILFAAVQITMVAAGLWRGERPHPLEWAGMLTALGGLFYLVSPGLTAPSLKGAALMATAGMAWGVYSLRGRGVPDATAATADNFIRSVPLVLLAVLLMMPEIRATGTGVLWAVSSGAITSGLGYVLWYAALRGLTATRAAFVQLSVPVLAAMGGVLVLSEEITVRLLISAVATLGGIALALTGRKA